MNLNELKPAKGSVRKKTRIARGQGSGKGGTSTRGHKGAKSRSGYKNKRNYEGGQMPLQMRLPKRGFKNPNRKNYTALNVGFLQDFANKYGITDITPEVLNEKGVIKKSELIKVLNRGELSSAINVTAHAASESAVKSVEEKGGKVTIA